MESLVMIYHDLLESFHENVEHHADPRTRDWFFIQRNPVYVIVATMLYLIFLYVGPKVMENRKAYDFRHFLAAYNLFCVGLSVYMFVEMLLSTYAAGYFVDIACQPYNAETRKNPLELRVAKVMWWYFFSKLIEFMDTILMVLRKKNRQITFLHVFHHASMLNIWWWVMMFIPGGHSWFGSCLNCLVHVVMYAYYGLSVYPSLHRYLWWKKYITKFQLIQFVFTGSHATYSLISECDFPTWGKYLLMGYMIILIILFANFYIHAYFKRQSAHHAKSLSNGTTPNRIASSDSKDSGSNSSHCSNGYTNGFTVNDGMKMKTSGKKDN